MTSFYKAFLRRTFESSRKWINAVALLELILLFSQFCSLCILRRNSTVCSISFPQSGQLSGYLLVSLFPLVVVAFADQIWTPTRVVASVHVSATFA